jgi:hypothetical protein
MGLNLGKIINEITTGKESIFISSLKEELNDRLYQLMAERYVNICENLYLEKNDDSESGLTPVQEEIIKIENKPINSLIATLQESIKDEKTIIHRFLTGESIAITQEDSKCLINLHDSLNRINQDKMRKLMSENFSEYNKILQFSKKYTERTLR